MEAQHADHATGMVQSDGNDGSAPFDLAEALAGEATGLDSWRWDGIAAEYLRDGQDPHSCCPAQDVAPVVRQS